MTTTPAREESSALLLQRDMKEILKAEVGLLDEFAESIADALVRGWRKRCGKQSIYIPGSVDYATRDAEIRRRFNGTNHAELCKEFDISRPRLYAICAKARTQLQT